MSYNTGLDRMAIADRIIARRVELGLSRSNVDDRAGFHRGRLGTVENIGMIPTGERLDRLARALETTPHWLLTGE